MIVSDRSYRRTQLPAPKPDRYAYTFNRWMALATSPKRLANYIRYKRAGRTGRLRYLPVKLDIENVSRCNFHCTMCQVSDWPGYKRAEDMTLAQFKELIDSQYGLIEIKLQGMGEPLLGRDDFFEMIKYARSKHIWVRTTTNASILHHKDNYIRLVETGVNEIQISIDGASRETFEAIRRGSKFELVTENCKLINDYCNKRKLWLTKMWVVLQKDNLHEFRDFVRLSHELGFKRLTYALNLTDWGQDRWNAINNAVTVEDSISPEAAHAAIEEGQKKGVEVAFWNVTSKYSPDSPKTLCAWPFERAYVSSDMRVVPCCKIGNPEVSELGDARHFTQIWNSKEYEEFRQAHIEGRIPAVCVDCYETKH